MFVYMCICLCVSCYVVLYNVVMHLIVPILIEKQPKRCYMVDNWQLRSSHIIFCSPPPPFFLSIVYFSNRTTARIFSRIYFEHLITRRLTAFPTHLVILEPPKVISLGLSPFSIFLWVLHLSPHNFLAKKTS